MLGVDVGLGDVDPRRLAEGRWGELMRVAETLCWLGKKMGYISQDGLSVGNVARTSECTLDEGDDGGRGGRGKGRAEVPGSPSMQSTRSTRTGHDSPLLTFCTHSLDDSQTTVTTHLASDVRSQDADETLEEYTFPILGGRSPRGEPLSHHDHEHVHVLADDDEDTQTDIHPLRRPSRCYDYESDLSDVDDSSWDPDLETSKSLGTSQPVRTTGYLELVDLEEELRAFELSRKRLTRHNPHLHRHHHERFPLVSTCWLLI